MNYIKLQDSEDTKHFDVSDTLIASNSTNANITIRKLEEPDKITDIIPNNLENISHISFVNKTLYVSSDHSIIAFNEELREIYNLIVNIKIKEFKIHPIKQYVAILSEDLLEIQLWNLTKKTLISKQKFPNKIKDFDFGYKGQSIIVAISTFKSPLVYWEWYSSRFFSFGNVEANNIKYIPGKNLLTYCTISYGFGFIDWHTLQKTETYSLAMTGSSLSIKEKSLVLSNLYGDITYWEESYCDDCKKEHWLICYRNSLSNVKVNKTKLFYSNDTVSIYFCDNAKNICIMPITENIKTKTCLNKSSFHYMNNY